MHGHVKNDTEKREIHVLMKQHDRNNKKRKRLQSKKVELLSPHMLILKMKDSHDNDLHGETVHIMQHMFGGKLVIQLHGEEMDEHGLVMQRQQDMLQVRNLPLVP